MVVTIPACLLAGFAPSIEVLFGARLLGGVAAGMAYPTTLAFPYLIKGDRKPFNVTAIFHDDRFTYIKADTAELPSLYEVVDNAPSLVNFQVERGFYVVSKILDRGYLTIGMKKLTFERAK